MPKYFVETNHAYVNDNVIAHANTNTIVVLYHQGRGAMANLDYTANQFLDGQGSIGRKAAQTAYAFTIYCMDHLDEAAHLPGWDKAKVQAGANPYCQPLKLLTTELTNVVQSKITIWAKVFRHAHEQGIAPDDILEHVKRNHSMRRWYDAIVLAEKNAANDNDPDQNDSVKPKPNKNAGKKKANDPVDVVTELARDQHIVFAALDYNILIGDPGAMAVLESLSPYITLVQANDDDCRAFMVEHDPRFANKGAA